MPSAIAHTSILQPLRKSTSKRAAAIPSSGAQGLGKPENRVSRTAPMPQARESLFCSQACEKSAFRRRAGRQPGPTAVFLRPGAPPKPSPLHDFKSRNPAFFFHKPLRQGAARFAPPLPGEPAKGNAIQPFSLRPNSPRRASSASRFQTPKPRILCAGPAAAPACFASRLYKPAGNSPARRKFPDHWPAPWSCAASRPVPPRSSAASSASGRTASARAFISPASACVCSSRRARAGASSAVKTP